MIGINKVVNSKMRKGTKFVIINWIVVISLITFMIVGLSLVVILASSEKSTLVVNLVDKLNIAAVITALLGQSGVATVANSVRIAIENRNGRKEGDSA